MKAIFTRTIWVGKGTVVLVGLAVILATLVFAAPAWSGGAAKTTLTIKAEGTDLSGKVKSPKLRCVGDREIKLYKQRGSEQKPRADTLVATDTSERRGDHGEWSTGNTGMSGKFYVRTGKVPGCKADASKTIRVRR